MVRPQQRMIDLDGAPLAVFTAGTGAPVMCRSHPFGSDADEFASGEDAPWPWDGSSGLIVGVDPRGVANSSPGREPRDFTVRQHVEDLEAVRRHLGVDWWVFWGSSGGGCIALLYALTYPQALSGVIIAKVGPSGRRVGADPRSHLSPFHPQYQEELSLLTTASPLQRRPAIFGSPEPRRIRRMGTDTG